MTPDPGSVDRSGAPPGPVRAPARCVTVQRQFDQRAARFANAGAIVREVGQRLIERLNYIRHDARVVLDLGCGQAVQRAALLERFAHATWLGVDLSCAMLARGRIDTPATIRWLRRLLHPRQRTARICANADQLPAWVPGDEFEAARKKSEQ